jgi:gamma-glutamyl:cysteine ligase YbdK (ATP-grasp superfamily)
MGDVKTVVKDSFDIKRNIKEYMKSDTEVRMRSAFREQSNSILMDEDKFYKGNDHKIVIGLETEYGAIDINNYKQIPEEERNKIISGLNFAAVELGASQIEIRTDPIILRSLEDLEKELIVREQQILARAEKDGIFIVRCGTNPFIQINEIKRTRSPKYKLVPNFHDAYRNPAAPSVYGLLETIDPRSASIVSLFNATQVNIEASGFADAIEKLNYSYMIAPYVVSIGGNARFIAGRDLGYADVRMPIWEISHDIRTTEELLYNAEPRVGRYDSYVKDMKDYFDRIARLPFILDNEENALKIGIGLFWKDVRIKFIGNSCVVETRPFSTQPTPAEDIAMHAFYLGRLLYSQSTREPLLDIGFVNVNRENARNFGLNARLIYRDENNNIRMGDAKIVLALEIKRAEEGLQRFGLCAEKYFNILKERLRTGNTPSQIFAQEFAKNRSKSVDIKNSLFASLLRISGDRYGKNKGDIYTYDKY